MFAIYWFANFNIYIVYANNTITYTFTKKGKRMDKKTKYSEKYIQIGLNIAYYRKLRRMTQMQLAEAVNISRTHMSNIEAPNVPTSVSLDTLFEIADVLNVDITSLFDIKK